MYLTLNLYFENSSMSLAQSSDVCKLNKHTLKRNFFLLNVSFFLWCSRQISNLFHSLNENSLENNWMVVSYVGTTKAYQQYYVGIKENKYIPLLISFQIYFLFKISRKINFLNDLSHFKEISILFHFFILYSYKKYSTNFRIHTIPFSEH